MKIEEIKKLFVAGAEIVRYKPFRMSKPDHYSINDKRITYNQVQKLSQLYEIKETYKSNIENVIVYVGTK